MQSNINKDYQYIKSKKNLLFSIHKKIIEIKSKETLNCKFLRFFFLELYQEGFMSNYYYGFSITSKCKSNVKLFRPSDRSFLSFSLSFPGLLYGKKFSKD